MKKEIKKLAQALQATKPLKPRGKPTPQAIAPYRFKPGQSGNPSGRPRDHAREAMNRLAHTSPPRALCQQVGIAPGCTWVEAIVFALGKAAANGDVSAAREVLANLGLRGTAASNLLAVNVDGSPDQRSVTFEFLQHSHGLGEADLQKVFAFMDKLPRERPVVDASYYPTDETQLLEDGNGEKEN